MRKSFGIRSVLVLLLFLFLLGPATVLAAEPPEPQEIGDALGSGDWGMLIDIFPIQPLFGPRVQGIKGRIDVHLIMNGFVMGEYTYPTVGGNITGKFQGKIEGGKLSVKGTEKGLLAQKIFGEFIPEYNGKDGQIIAFRGWWKVHATDSELRWDIVRPEPKKEKEKKQK